MSKPKLALIPSGYKSGKVYSILPNDATGDFDFTRQSIGTRVRKDGLIEEAKTSGSITNILQRSEEFDNSYWSKQGGCTVTSNTTLAPNGTLTADTLSGATGTSVSGTVLRRNVVISGISTLSIYVKSLGSTNFTIYIRNGANGQVFSQSITPNSDWQRVTLTTDPANGQVFFGNTNGDVAIWGAMLSEGALSDYIKTEGTTETKTVETFTDVPRLDWSNSNCPSLLLEPQRTNLHTYSEISTGKTIQNVTLTDNSAISPNGELTAIKVTDDSVNFRHRFWANNVSVTSGTQYTISFYVKKDSPNRYIYINAGILGTNGSFSLDDQSTTGSVQVFETLNNDWYRIGLTGTAPTTQTTIWFLQMQLGTTDANYIGDGSSFYVWGLQFEQGSYPTSYIKTEASTVTRLKDECLNGGDSDLFNSVEGVIYAEFKNHTELGSFRQINLKLNSLNRIYISKRSDNGKLEFRMENPLGSRNFSFVQNTSDDYLKVAFRYAPNNFAVFINGVNKNVSSSGSTFAEGTLTTLEFASPLANQNFYGKVKDLRVYNEALTDAELIELTTI